MLQIHVLDVGKAKYGDCILVTRNNRCILIDGAHQGDRALIRSQLKTIFNKRPPFVIDLLVVTHCHSDHIGCLPELIASGDIQVKNALVADEKLGFGRDIDGNSPVGSSDFSDTQRNLFIALQEEDYSDLQDVDLELFIDDAIRLEDRYIEMLDDLQQHDTKVIRYGRDTTESILELETSFDDFGLRILGPTLDHLLICTQAIANVADLIIDNSVSQHVDDQLNKHLSSVYRQLIVSLSQDDAIDQAGIGAAKNNQSIILKIQADGWSTLLGGDMQFALPQVPGLAEEMRQLRINIQEAGPYDFIKLTHHSSYNAVSSDILDQWYQTKLFAHTGGLNDPNHPEENVLEVLKAKSDHLLFARTDRNGLVTVTKDDGEEIKMNVSRGHLNDFSLNIPKDQPVNFIEANRPTVQSNEYRATQLSSIVPQENRHKMPLSVPMNLQESTDQGTVEIITRIPHKSTKVTLTIEIEPHQDNLTSSKPKASFPDAVLRLGGGRNIPPLLFVTCIERLSKNIGESESNQIVSLIQQHPNALLVNLPANLGTAEEATLNIRQALGQYTVKGVVLVGGYDVVPSQIVDVLDAPLRMQLERESLIENDADEFVVWSDDLYGDLDGDSLPEIPVSRLPDGHQADVLLGSLMATSFTPSSRFGVRNIARPFAEETFSNVPGFKTGIQVSETYGSTNILPNEAAGAVYFMLHGAVQDSTKFWGERKGGGPYEAVSIENVPASALGTVVFTGCCWGALTIGSPAIKALAGTVLRPKTPENSIALAYLRAGALGFVGCTGSHYSPTISPYNYFGKPMHDAFWLGIQAGLSPAEALFEAKKSYIRNLPHSLTDSFSKAIELKIVRQFTCLGLGW